MTLAEYNAFCRTLAHTGHVVQWGGAHVWKVAGKVFAIAWPDEDDPRGLHVTFKCSPMSFDLLKEMEGLRPAPYLASRGMSWIQRTDRRSMNDATLRDYLAESHRIVAAGLSQRRQRELGLAEAAPRAPARRKAGPQRPKSTRHPRSSP